MLLVFSLVASCFPVRAFANEDNQNLTENQQTSTDEVLEEDTNKTNDNLEENNDANKEEKEITEEESKEEDSVIDKNEDEPKVVDKESDNNEDDSNVDDKDSDIAQDKSDIENKTKDIDQTIEVENILELSSLNPTEIDLSTLTSGQTVEISSTDTVDFVFKGAYNQALNSKSLIHVNDDYIGKITFDSVIFNNNQTDHDNIIYIGKNCDIEIELSGSNKIISEGNNIYSVFKIDEESKVKITGSGSLNVKGGVKSYQNPNPTQRPTILYEDPSAIHVAENAELVLDADITAEGLKSGSGILSQGPIPLKIIGGTIIAKGGNGEYADYINEGSDAMPGGNGASLHSLSITGGSLEAIGGGGYIIDNELSRSGDGGDGLSLKVVTHQNTTSNQISESLIDAPVTAVGGNGRWGGNGIWAYGMHYIDNTYTATPILTIRSDVSAYGGDGIITSGSGIALHSPNTNDSKLIVEENAKVLAKAGNEIVDMDPITNTASGLQCNILDISGLLEAYAPDITGEGEGIDCRDATITVRSSGVIKARGGITPGIFNHGVLWDEVYPPIKEAGGKVYAKAGPSPNGTLINESYDCAFGTVSGNNYKAVEDTTFADAQTDNPPLTKIEVTSLPTILNYKAGDYIKFDGLKITALYEDGSSSIIKDYETNISEKTKFNEASFFEVIVTYSENTLTQRASFPITIWDNDVPSSKTLGGIFVTKVPEKTEYISGEYIDMIGAIIKAFYSDNTYEEITNYTTQPDSSTPLKKSNSTIEISFGGKTTKLKIKVTDGIPTNHTITFNTNGGSEILSIVKPQGYIITTVPTSTKSGYSFEGWYSDSGLTNKIVFPYTIKADATFYAKWIATTPTINYTITFNTNGGTAVNSIIQQAGTQISSSPATTKAGYTFGGWYSDSALTKQVSFPYIVVSNTTLYAKWTYNSNNGGGSGGSSSSSSGSSSSSSSSTSNQTTTTPTVAPPTADKTIADQITAGSQPTIKLTEKVTSTNITGKTLKSTIDNKNGLAITNGAINVNLSPALIQSINPGDSDKFEISVKSIEPKLVDSLKNVDSLNTLLLKQAVDIKIKNDSNLLTTFTQPIIITMDISSINFTDEQLKKLTGVKFLADGNVKQLGGKVNGGKITFETSSLSNYGVIISDTLLKISTTIDNKNFTINESNKTTDVAPTIMDGHAMIPVRFVAEAFGAEVSWIPQIQTVKINLNDKDLTFRVGQKLPGTDAVSIISNNRTLVPLRYVSEQLGGNVVWNESTKTIDIYR